MFIKVMAVIIAAVLVFSGAAATAYASQLSLPMDALYGVKTFGENIRLSLAPQSDSKLGLALEFTQRRVDEMAALNRLGMNVPDHVASQYLVQVEYTLQLAAGLSDDHITPALELIRTHLQEQLHILDQLHQANLNDPALIQASEQLNEQLRLVEAGLQNPQQFRQQMRARELEAQQAAPSETERPSPTNTAGAGNNNASAGGNTNENLNGNENNNGNDNGNQDAEGNLNDNPNDNGDDQDGNGNDNGGHGNDNDNGDDNGGNGNDNGDDNGGGNGNENDDENGGGGNSNGDANNNNSVGNGNENDNHNSSRQSD